MDTIKNFFTNENVLAILTWIGSIGAITIAIRLTFKYIKRFFIFIKNSLILRDIILDENKFTKIRDLSSIVLANTNARLIKELSEEGIVNFFPYYETYMAYTDHGKPAEYIKTATSKLLYAGFWLTSSIGCGGIPDALECLLLNGVEVSIVLMNPYSQNTIEFCENFFGFDQHHIETEFIKALQQLHRVYNSNKLSKDIKKLFHVKLHNEPLTAAAFIIDWDSKEKAKILLDTKIHRTAFSDGYGFEIKDNPKSKIKADTIYNRIKKSYLSFIEEHEGYSVQTIDINLNSNKRINDIVKEIKEATNEKR